MKFINLAIVLFSSSINALRTPRRLAGNGGGGNGGGGNGGGGNGGGGGGGGDGEPSSPTPSNGLFCGTVPLTTYRGEARPVNVDNSSGFAPTMGDVSIAEAIVPVNNSDNSEVSIKAICTLTADDPSVSAPFCTFESSLTLSTGVPGVSFQGKTMAMGTPPFLAIMGGTGDFMGAYGQFDTQSSFTSSPTGTEGNIIIEFDAVVDFCVPTSGGVDPPSPCLDSLTWKTLSNGREKDCLWLGRNSNQVTSRCNLVGTDGTTGNESCPLTCGSCTSS